MIFTCLQAGHGRPELIRDDTRIKTEPEYGYGIRLKVHRIGGRERGAGSSHVVLTSRLRYGKHLIIITTRPDK